MSKTSSRRDFCRFSLATGCMAAFSRPLQAKDAGEKEHFCDELVKNKQDEVWAQELKEKIRLLVKLREKLGDDVVKITRQHTAGKIEKEYAEKAIEKRDLSAVKSQLWDGLPKDQFEFKKIQDSAERLEYRVTRCALADLLKDLNQPELAYALICAWDEGFCKGINPGITFTRTETLMQGNDCCNHTYELKRTNV